MRIDEASAVIAEAEKKMAAAGAPKATLLPVEPPPASNDAWKETAPKRIVNLGLYQFSGSDFDVTFITPLLNHVMHHPPERTTGASKPGGTQDMSDLDPSRRALEDFGNWTDYVDAIPPVLIVRVTPKFKENFWTTVGRVAASTQGVSLPPFRKSGAALPTCGSPAVRRRSRPSTRFASSGASTTTPACSRVFTCSIPRRSARSAAR